MATNIVSQQGKFQNEAYSTTSSSNLINQSWTTLNSTTLCITYALIEPRTSTQSFTSTWNHHRSLVPPSMHRSQMRISTDVYIHTHRPLHAVNRCSIDRAGRRNDSSGGRGWEKKLSPRDVRCNAERQRNGGGRGCEIYDNR